VTPLYSCVIAPRTRRAKWHTHYPGLCQHFQICKKHFAAISRKRAISPEMAVLLSIYFGTSDSYWINLQGHYNLVIAKDRIAKQAARIHPHPHDENGALQPI
jgi:plasmid maintenance system antidote protein VapI